MPEKKRAAAKPRPKKPKPTPPPGPAPSRNGHVGYFTEDQSPPPPATSSTSAAHKGVCAADVVESDVEWLVPGYVPEGLVTLVTGEGDTGKTTWMSGVAALVTGGISPFGRCPVAPGRVLWYVSEEDISSMTLPKLRAAGAIVDRVTFPLQDQYGFQRSHLALPSGLKALETRVVEDRVRLIVLDPCSSFLDPGFDERDKGHVRALIEGISQLCKRTNCTVLMTVHNRKSREGSAMNRVGGSAAWTQTPRMVLCLGTDPDVPSNRILAVGRCAFAPPAPSARYVIEGEPGRGRVRMLGECQLTAIDIGAEGVQRGDRDALRDARAFLVAELDAEELAVKEVERRANEAGIRPHTLRNAKEALGVESHQIRGTTSSYWVWRKPSRGWPT